MVRYNIHICAHHLCSLQNIVYLSCVWGQPRVYSRRAGLAPRIRCLSLSLCLQCLSITVRVMYNVHLNKGYRRRNRERERESRCCARNSYRSLSPKSTTVAVKLYECDLYWFELGVKLGPNLEQAGSF